MKEVKIKFRGVQAGDFKLDAAEITVPEESAEVAEVLIQNVYDAAEHITKLRGDLAEMTGERDTLQKSLTDSKNISPEKLDAMSEERRVIVDVAEHAGFKRDELQTVGNSAIKEMVVRKDDDTISDDVDPLYLDGCFHQIQKRMDREDDAKKAMGKLGDVTRPNRVDGEDKVDHEDEQSYREASQAKLQGVHGKTDAQLKEDGWHN